jgi:hypothetical protein
MLSVIMLSVIMLSVIMLSVIMLSVIMLNVTFCVVMLNIVMLSVVVPLTKFLPSKWVWQKSVGPFYETTLVNHCLIVMFFSWKIYSKNSFIIFFLLMSYSA